MKISSQLKLDIALSVIMISFGAFFTYLMANISGIVMSLYFLISFFLLKNAAEAKKIGDFKLANKRSLQFIFTAIISAILLLICHWPIIFKL